MDDTFFIRDRETGFQEVDLVVDTAFVEEVWEMDRFVNLFGEIMSANFINEVIANEAGTENIFDFDQISSTGQKLSETPTLFVIDEAEYIYEAPVYPNNPDVVPVLTERIEQLEESNFLLTSDLITNTQAFWKVCSTDVLGLCDVSFLQGLDNEDEQTIVATDCLIQSYVDIASQDCRVGVDRMKAWYQMRDSIKNTHIRQGMGNSDANLVMEPCDSVFSGPNAEVVLLCTMALACFVSLILTICRCVMVRNRCTRNFTKNTSTSILRSTTSASACENGACVVHDTRFMDDDKNKEKFCKVRGVKIDMQIEDGKRYL
jgi:hypothetical protein